MKNAFAHALFALAVVATTGCVSQEYAASPSCPSYGSKGAAAVDKGTSGLDPNLFVGTWAGRGCQSDGPCWTLKIQIEPDEQGNPVGRLAYPSVPCAARLEFVQWELDDVAAFRERFADPGKCVPDGWVRLRLLDADRMAFEWAFPDGRVDAATTLDRAR
jgi:hypothetical protein